MRYDAEHKEKTRARVLKEAAKAIRAEGPHRIAVAGVMAKAGLTHGGFYAHFASKDALVADAIEQMFKESRGRFTRTTEGLPPAESLAAYIDFYLSPEHRDARDTGCPLPSLSADLPRLSEGARARFSSGVLYLTEAIAGKLAALGFAAPELEAASVLSELVGALSLARAVADAGQSDAILQNSKAALKTRLDLKTPLGLKAAP